MNLKTKMLYSKRPETERQQLIQKMKPGEVAVEMKSITKRFSNVIANDHIDFEVKAGEVHALLGENGAGKTTLVNILYGLYQQDDGEIHICGKKVEIRSPQDAIKLGIGMVHQLFKQVYQHTVAENVALSVGSSKLFPVRKVKQGFIELSREFGWDIDPNVKIWQLSAAKRQQIEILKTIYQGGRILIFDEPTSVLTPQEKETLFKRLRELKDEGYAIIYITHKLDEVFRISDRVTVLRNGKKVKTLTKADASRGKLAKLMVGREILFDLKRESVEPGSPVLETKNLYIQGDQDEMAVNGVSFTLREKEIIGLAGIGGNGQKELIEALTGLRKVKDGSFYIFGHDLTNASPRKIKEQGVAYVPEDRTRRGIVPQMSVKYNLILRDYYKPPYCKRFFLNMEEIQTATEERLSRYNIVAPHIDAPTNLLSGGNLQRLILARELSGNPRLLIAAYPTQGLDVGSTEAIRKLFLNLKREGCGIFFTSEELDEILMLSDRIAVIYEGKLQGIVDAEKVGKEELGLLMTGTSQEEVLQCLN